MGELIPEQICGPPVIALTCEERIREQGLPAATPSDSVLLLIAGKSSASKSTANASDISPYVCVHLQRAWERKGAAPFQVPHRGIRTLFGIVANAKSCLFAVADHIDTSTKDGGRQSDPLEHSTDGV